MNFPKGTQFKTETDKKTNTTVKIAILPDGTILKFHTEEELENI